MYYEVELLEVDAEVGKNMRHVTLDAIPRIGETVVVDTNPYVSFRVIGVNYYTHNSKPRNSHVTLEVEKLP